MPGKEGDIEEPTEQVKTAVDKNDEPFEVEHSTTMSSHIEVGKLKLKEGSEVAEKEMNEVGKLRPREGSEVAEKEMNEVGRISPQEPRDVLEEIFEGTFGGFGSKRGAIEEESVQEEGPTGGHLIMPEETGAMEDMIGEQRVDQKSPPLDDKHTVECIGGGPESIDEDKLMLDVHLEDDEVKAAKEKGKPPN